MNALSSRKSHSRVTVAQYLEQQIALSEKSQKDIAEECGYDRPNILTMIKQGHTKLPINKIGVMARALNVDPTHLFRLVFQEYLPELWDSIQPYVGQSLVSEDEVAALRVLRDAQCGVNVDWSSEAVKKAVSEALSPFVETEVKSREGAANLVRKTRSA